MPFQRPSICGHVTSVVLIPSNLNHCQIFRLSGITYLHCNIILFIRVRSRVVFSFLFEGGKQNFDDYIYVFVRHDFTSRIANLGGPKIPNLSESHVTDLP